MSEPSYEPEVQVSDYGRARREAWLAALQRNADAMTAAEMARHAPDSAILRRSQRGILGMSGHDAAAALAAQQPTVGSGTDAGGRPLERNGGTFDHAASGPAPARVDLTRVGQVQQPGESPLARYMRERQ